MNLGGEPDRDDSGLPPVDVVVPDDARDLERDVQAYYREQRALRRDQRRSRWHAPLARDGMIVPLLAGCLILALVSGTLLTVFTAWPGNQARPAPSPVVRNPGNPARISQQSSATSPSAGSSPASSSPASTALTGAAALPDATLLIGRRKVSAAALRSVVLALVPARCDCTGAMQALAAQAARAHVPLTVVATPRGVAAARQLAAAARADRAQVAEDVADRLGQAYQRNGLTTVLVSASGSVRVARQLTESLELSGPLHGLTAGPAGG